MHSKSTCINTSISHVSLLFVFILAIALVILLHCLFQHSSQAYFKSSCTCVCVTHRPNAFSLSLMGKESSLVLSHVPHDQNDEEILKWTEVISTNILAMNNKEVQRLRENFDLDDVSIRHTFRG